MEKLNWEIVCSKQASGLLEILGNFLKEAAAIAVKKEYTSAPPAKAPRSPSKSKVKKQRTGYQLFQSHKMKELKESTPVTSIC